jgi:hypothetical protein
VAPRAEHHTLLVTNHHILMTLVDADLLADLFALYEGRELPPAAPLRPTT